MRIVYSCLMLLCLTVPVFAQDEMPRAGDIVTSMQSQLSLTQDQILAVTPIIEKYVPKWQELTKSLQVSSADAGSMRAQIKQLRKDEFQDLSLVLSEDQLSRWQKMMRRSQLKSATDENSEGNHGASSS